MNTPSAAPDQPATPASTGAARSTDALFHQVYDRLKAMASRNLDRHAPASLDTTSLVHELYLRMGDRGLCFEQPEQFFAYAARAMRHLLADRARSRLRLARGGGWQSITLDGDDDRFAIDSAEQAIQIENALVELEQLDPRAARVVELRYFCGLTQEQVADALGLAPRTIVRDWRFARAFLHERV
jgi:RNA polymerase sigma factor (TIGR02999 family)